MKIKFKFLIFFIFFVFLNNQSYSEPFVVLEYRGGSSNNVESSSNAFINDFNYSVKHVVKKNQTLSDIILKYYGKNELNKDLLTLSIVHFNKHAFVRKNPNYLYADKKIYLPSINEIKSLIINKSKRKKTILKEDKHIYFFGG